VANPPLAGGVLQTDPGPTTYGASVQAVFEYVNAERTRSGLGVLRQAPILDLAAADHANYLALNPDLGATHDQVAGRPGFVGATIRDRISLRNYVGAAFETIALSTSALEGVRSLNSAPYHRLGLLSAGDSQFGGSYVATGASQPATPGAPGFSPLVVFGGAIIPGGLQPMRPEAAGVSLHPAAGAQAVPLLMFPELPTRCQSSARGGQAGAIRATR